MNDVELMAGLKQIEQRWGKGYSRIELEMFEDKFGWMTAEDWERFCGIVLHGSDWFPPGKRFDEFYEQHRNEFPKPPRVRVHCDKCKGKGVRQWVRRGGYGDVERKAEYDTPVARCDCPNGRNWPAFPTMKAVMEQSKDRFVRWVKPGESDAHARANPFDGMREPGED
jgi:hypothetical protein